MDATQQAGDDTRHPKSDATPLALDSLDDLPVDDSSLDDSSIDGSSIDGSSIDGSSIEDSSIDALPVAELHTKEPAVLYTGDKLPAQRPGRSLEAVVGPDLIEFFNLRHDEVDPSCFHLMSISVARSRRAAPVSIDDDLVTVGISDASDIVAMDDLRLQLARYEVKFVSVADISLDALLARWAREVARADESAAASNLAFEARTSVVEEADDSGPMATLVNKLLEQAIVSGASDVHIEPTDAKVFIRFRIDGVLQEHTQHPLSIAGGIVNRVKILSGMEIAERRIPQDGRFGRTLSGREIDCRVVSLPTASGNEGLVMRLFDQSRARKDLNEIGFHESALERFESILGLPHGLILVTGPTGSGKTTTLYASLGLVAREDRKTLTIEDPVEIRLPSVTQVQVNEKAGLTFASALRSFLRADPDVMLVGEIRDAETASLAAQAALTGHLVLSTLHTNEASGAATRLSNLGLEPFVTASALKAVLAQRLIRRLCSYCALPYEPTDEELELARWPERLPRPERLFKASEKGCADCANLGYRGRVPVAELVLVDDKMVAGIIARASSGELERIAIASGTVPLHEDACLFAVEGVTSLAEIVRVGV